jgi:hypothetical protein
MITKPKFILSRPKSSFEVTNVQVQKETKFLQETETIQF